MTDLGLLCKRLYQKIEWQKLPISNSPEEVETMLVNSIVDAIQDLFVVTGRALAYYSYEMVIDDDCGRPTSFAYDLLLDEELYVLTKAQIDVYSKVRTQYSDILGYTTNALTVTNADKPYQYLSGTIGELNEQLKVYYYKMVRFSHLD